ncbi:MAG TPA: MFS transporter [Mycobacteriales bacterium]|nr:MFS transporter [Mycobacteriales bacterium]
MSHATQSRPRLTFAVLCVATTAYSVTQSFLLPVLPVVEKHFHTSQDTAAWVITLFLLSAAVATPILGRLGDIVGKEKVLVGCIALLGAGSVLGALAPNISVLFVSRAIQGMGGAIFPLAFGIIRDEFPEERVAGAIGTVSSLLAAGGGLGLVFAGPVTTHLGFAWLFWLPLPFVVFGALATWLWIPESPVRASGSITLLPSLTLSLWLVGLLLGVSEGPSWGWTDPKVIGLLAAFIIAFAAWVAVENRSQKPLIDMKMMRIPAVWRTNVVALAFGAVQYSFLAIVPAFIETAKSSGYGFGLSVTTTGFYEAPFAAAMFIVGFMVGRLTERIGSRGVTFVGGAMTAVTYFVLAFSHTNIGVVSAMAAVFGIGMALGFSALSTLVVEAVRPDQVGAAAGMNTNVRTIGGAIGTTVVTLIVTSGVHGDQAPHESGYTTAFIVLGITGLVSALAALAVPTRRDDEPFVHAARVAHHLEDDAELVPSA